MAVVEYVDWFCYGLVGQARAENPRGGAHDRFEQGVEVDPHLE